jgi:hypothetical protein
LITESTLSIVKGVVVTGAAAGDSNEMVFVATTFGVGAGVLSCVNTLSAFAATEVEGALTEGNSILVGVAAAAGGV